MATAKDHSPSCVGRIRASTRGWRLLTSRKIPNPMTNRLAPQVPLACASALVRANGICEKCRKRPATEVHHLKYERVFNELPSDLVALCRQCHSEIHWRQPANDNQIQF